LERETNSLHETLETTNGTFTLTPYDGTTCDLEIKKREQERPTPKPSTLEISKVHFLLSDKWAAAWPSFSDICKYQVLPQEA
jgi:hypothetical protein